jgi:hypothetical protein
VLAAVLLFLAKRIAGAALYCELNASCDSDRWHCSTTGEADLAWLSLGRAAKAELVRGADLFADAWTLNANVGAGPATLIGIAAVAGRERRAPLRLVAVEGTALPLEDLALPRGVFSFLVPRDDADALLARWLDAGPSHHACLVHGHVAANLQVIARLTGAELVLA